MSEKLDNSAYSPDCITDSQRVATWAILDSSSSKSNTRANNACAAPLVTRPSWLELTEVGRSAIAASRSETING